jgi:tellurite resistance protein TerC
MSSVLFPFVDYWWLYLAFTSFVVLLLAIDLSFHRKEKVVSFRQAAVWTAFWMALALAFSYGLYLFASASHSPAIARQGYIVEESLSIDNMFIFALVFRYFAVPSRYQHRVLFYGVLGAMVFRGIFIAIGSALIRFHWIMILFGLFLVFTGIRLAFEKEKQIDPGDSVVIRWARRLLPVTSELHGRRFFATVDGLLHMTPLMIVLLFLETTDIIFAVDSVPAVFAVTSEPLVVYTSNVFAILGLRAMYFLLSGAMDRFHALKYGLATVLVFVGLKMSLLDDLFGGRFPIGASLAIISAVIATSIVLSLAFPAPAGKNIAIQGIARRVTGGACLLFAATSLLFAIGLTRHLGPLPWLVHVSAESLYLSAVCYAICGLLLIRNGQAGKG